VQKNPKPRTEPKNWLTEIFGSVTIQVLDELKFSVNRKTVNQMFGSVTVWNFFEPKNRLTDFRLTETPVNRYCTPLVESSPVILLVIMPYESSY